MGTGGKLTCSGSVDFTGITVTTGTSELVMTGASSVLHSASQTLKYVTPQASITFDDDCSISGLLKCITPGAVLTFYNTGAHVINDVQLAGTSGSHVTVQRTGASGAATWTVATRPQTQITCTTVSYINITPAGYMFANDGTNTDTTAGAGNTGWFFTSYPYVFVVDKYAANLADCTATTKKMTDGSPGDTTTSEGEDLNTTSTASVTIIADFGSAQTIGTLATTYWNSPNAGTFTGKVAGSATGAGASWTDLVTLADPSAAYHTDTSHPNVSYRYWRVTIESTENSDNSDAWVGDWRMTIGTYTPPFQPRPIPSAPIMCA
jgi:hypothetical protein